LAIAITPDGSTAYITEDGTPGHVVPLTLANGSLGTPITVGNNPQGIAITPDQATAYIANYNGLGASVVTPINLATNTAETPITVGDGPQSVAITPDQPPAASFTATPAPSGSTTSFDASASTVAYGSVTGYHWNFGDGTTGDTTTSTTTHTYATAGNYTVTLTETDTAGTSTSQLFDGQTMIRDGGPSAQTSQTLTINTVPLVTNQPAATTVTAPDQAQFTVACAGSPAPTVQWQASTGAGATWTDISGATATAMTVPATSSSLSGSQYRAVCTNVAGTATSDAAKLTVALAPPVLGVSFEAKPHGVVFVRTAKRGSLVQLSGPVDLPVGSLINARSGSVTLVMAMPAHRTQWASVWDGSFVVTQPRSKHGLTHIALAGESFGACPASPQVAHTSAASTLHKAAKRGHVVRHLWSKDDHGQFQTYGHDSVATVRGTEWLTEDRCDGTLTHVLHGVVSVRPRGKRHSITVTAGHSYLARP
jgi:DNA-binding beta-propeller fold protein YncE